LEIFNKIIGCLKCSNNFLLCPWRKSVSWQNCQAVYVVAMDLGPSNFMPRILLKNKLLSLITTDFTTILKFTDSIQRVNWDITLKFKFMKTEYTNSLEFFCDLYGPTSNFLILYEIPLLQVFLSQVIIPFSPSDIQTVMWACPCFLWSEVNAT
jgi:hypothetical protein